MERPEQPKKTTKRACSMHEYELLCVSYGISIYAAQAGSCIHIYHHDVVHLDSMPTTLELQHQYLEISMRRKLFACTYAITDS